MARPQAELAAATLLGILALSGTLIWGPESWAAWLSGLATEGRYVDSINPLADNRFASLAVAACGIVVGLVLGSPALVLAASILASPATSVHYLLTVAAGFVSEPPLAGRAGRWRVRRLGEPRSEQGTVKSPP